MMPSLLSLRQQVGTKAACHALNVPRASFYRQLKPKSAPAKAVPPLALSAEERQAVLDVAHEQRFWDLSPYQIHATLLDEGVYHCSIRTIYRILTAADEVRERRRQTRRGNYVKPERNVSMKMRHVIDKITVAPVGTSSGVRW